MAAVLHEEHGSDHNQHGEELHTLHTSAESAVTSGVRLRIIVNSRAVTLRCAFDPRSRPLVGVRRREQVHASLAQAGNVSRRRRSTSRAYGASR